MSRVLKGPEEIREIVRVRVRRITEVREDAVKIQVPLPQRTEPDRSGCNWEMYAFGGAATYEAAIRREVVAVRARVNLADQQGLAVPG